MSCDRRCFDKTNKWYQWDDCFKCPGRDDGAGLMGTPIDVPKTTVQEIAEEMDTVLARLNKPHGSIDWPFVINGWKRKLRQISTSDKVICG